MADAHAGLNVTGRLRPNRRLAHLIAETPVKAALSLLCLLAAATSVYGGPPANRDLREHRFTGVSAMAGLCACLLDARAAAEAQGRLDFNVDITFAATDPMDVTARIDMGSAHAVGRITFAGHGSTNDSTLRRAVTLYERDLFDVGKLRRSLSRINDLGLFEPLTLADIVIESRDDGVTADVTVPLRERRRRWWSLSGSLIPGLGSFEASIGSRLPPWGRGVFEASTYVVKLNLLGFIAPASGVWPIVVERPLVP
ncbi:MAG TPA: POTRA domain-containing protein, partial [Vicinamibacterales bacterium]|nr:POTRA domain-containing protein [Vicinamibacterales bacterium]